MIGLILLAWPYWSRRSTSTFWYRVDHERAVVTVTLDNSERRNEHMIVEPTTNRRIDVVRRQPGV